MDMYVDMVSCVVSKFAINISFRISYAVRAHSACQAGPTNWPSNGTVDVGERETRPPIRAASRDRLSSETSEMEARLMSRVAKV